MPKQPKKAARKADPSPAGELFKPAPTKLGRPTTYTPAIAAEICQRISNGELLTEICRDEHMPNRVAVWEWTERHKDFGNAYTHARQRQQHIFADEMLIRVKDESRDYYVDDKGIRRSDNTAVQRDKLVTDRMWQIMSRLNSEYAEKQRMEHSGPEGGPIPFLSIGIKGKE